MSEEGTSSASPAPAPALPAALAPVEEKPQVIRVEATVLPEAQVPAPVPAPTPAPKKKADKKSTPSRELRSLLSAIGSIEAVLKNRATSEDITTYGLPDLLRDKRDDETDEQYAAWQDAELRKFVEEKMWYAKNGEKHAIRLAPPMLKFLADLFFRRVQQGILWKPRGGGGSLVGALLIWLMMVFRRLSVTDMAGSQEQSKIVYEYTKGFWDCFPDLANNLLEKAPLVSETRLTNGVTLKTISATEKQARGKHNPVFLADESCQAAENTDAMIMAGMQGAMSEPKFCVVLLSTFHHPIGLFQEVWDFAGERGFARFKWDVYDVMEKCTAGLEFATAEDPKAIEGFCKTQCPLTEKRTTYDAEGNSLGWEWGGCNGRARESQGFMPRKNVIIAKKMNRGTNTFEVEFECQRPNWMRPVYDPMWIEAALVEYEWPDFTKMTLEELSVGIDWGFEGQTVLVLAGMVTPKLDINELTALRLMGEDLQKHVVILESESMTGKLTPEAIKIIHHWMEKYGPLHPKVFKVYPDISHPFNNAELEGAGFDVMPVPFQKWKDFGIGNCIKFFTAKKRLKIRNTLNGLIEQMKRYRQDRMGKPIKKDDHGPDAFMCSMIQYIFDERFGEDNEPTQEELEGKRDMRPHVMPNLPRKIGPALEGVSPPTPVRLDVPGLPPLAANIVKAKRNKDGQVVVL